MARGVNEWVRGRSCFGYRRTTMVVCCLNLVAAVYVLRSLYTSYYAVASASGAASAVKKNADQLKRMEESIQIRRALEPIELVKLVKALKMHLSAKAKNWELPQSVKQILAGEVLQKFRELLASANRTEQLDALESWRREKLQQIKKFITVNVTTNFTMSLSEAKILKKALKSELHILLEDFGLYIPEQITNKIDEDAGEDLEEEEEIIAGPPIPPECHVELHTDYAGAAVRWGLTHHKASAAECCQACLDQAKAAKPGEMKCNIWVYCPAEGGCYSPDKYEHKHQECWLKQDKLIEKTIGRGCEKWRVYCCCYFYYPGTCVCCGIIALAICVLIVLDEDPHPTLYFKDKYSESYRGWHPTAPVVVPWMAGVISS